MLKIWNLLTDKFENHTAQNLFLAIISLLGLFVGIVIAGIILTILPLAESKLFTTCIVAGYFLVFSFLVAIFFEYQHVRKHK